MSETETPTFAQRTARFSWQLFVVTILLVLLSRHIPGGLVVCESIAFFTMSAGVLCGVVSLFGIGQGDVRRVFFPAFAGIVLNGLLLFIFITNFTAARRAAQQRVQARTLPAAEVTSTSATSSTHLGTWQTHSPRGELMTWIFADDGVTFVLPKGRSVPFRYDIDYTKNPVWLTIHGEEVGKPSMLLIVEFVGDKQMRVLGSAPGSEARPAAFTPDRTDVLTFSKQP
jgi:uncharacterized protein (TIGR03067 family)